MAKPSELVRGDAYQCNSNCNGPCGQLPIHIAFRINQWALWPTTGWYNFQNQSVNCNRSCGQLPVDVKVKVKVKLSYYRSWTGLSGLRRLSLPEFLDNRHMKVARLSALSTGCLYLPEKIPGTHFCYRLSRPQGHSVAGRIK
jgi:hypothetical protein